MQLDLNDNFKNKILVAMPNTQHDIFKDSLIYITEHRTIAGTVGVMINKGLFDYAHDTIGDDTKELLSSDFAMKHDRWKEVPFYLGGPVDLGSGFLLYTKKGQSQLLLSESSKISLDLDGVIEPMLVASGYCMWDTLQLEREVKYNHWLMLEADDMIIHLMQKFKPELRYAAALNLLGVTCLANFDFASAGNA